MKQSNFEIPVERADNLLPPPRNSNETVRIPDEMVMMIRRDINLCVLSRVIAQWIVANYLCRVKKPPVAAGNVLSASIDITSWTIIAD